MPIPESIRKHRPEGFGALEIRCFGGNKFYVYQVSSVYDAAKGMRMIQGRDGTVAVATVRNHGAYAVLSALSPDLEGRLRAHFPDCWRQMRAFSLIRLVDKTSPRMLQHAFDASTFPKDIAHGENSVRALVRRLGGMDDRVSAFPARRFLL